MECYIPALPVCKVVHRNGVRNGIVVILFCSKIPYERANVTARVLYPEVIGNLENLVNSRLQDHRLH